MINRLTTATLLAVCLASTAASAATIGYWRFEEGALTQDSGPNSFTLTNSGSDNANDTLSLPSGSLPTTVPQTNAANGQAALLTLSDADYFSVADDSAFAVSAFTIEAFIRPEANNDNKPRTIAAQYDVAGQRAFQFSVSGDTAGGTASRRNLELTLSDDGTGGTNNQEIQLGGDFQLTNGNDYYVAATVEADATGTEIVFYVKDLTNNGPLIASPVQPLSFTTVNDSNSEFTIGATIASDDSPDGLFAGAIDEVRWSSTVLDESELLIVPEPGSLTLAAAGLLIIARRRNR